MVLDVFGGTSPICFFLFPRDKDAWIIVWKQYAWEVVSGARLLSKPFHDWELEVVTKLFAEEILRLVSSKKGG